ncbi:hypothetical protein MBLNU459_g4082t1 [Dothideomycetes sp. NU459]
MPDKPTSSCPSEDAFEIGDGRPPAPPTPPPLPSRPQQDIKMSKFALKVQAAPPGWYFDGWAAGPPPDPSDPPTGVYFFYGTLMDPEMLRDVLGIDELPQIRPATVYGYSCRAWGQYPVLVDSITNQVVSGRAWKMSDVKHARRLKEYETNSYSIRGAQIVYSDSLSPREQLGWTFMFAGRESELSDDKFDLDVWLKRMGRTPHKDSTSEGDSGRQHV